MSFSKCVSAALLFTGALAAPSDNFDLTHWKITLPVSNEAYFGMESSRGEENAAQIKPAHCDQPDFTGVGIDAGYEDSEFFYSEDDGAMVFKTPFEGGATTVNSDHVRSELREIFRGECDSDDSNWLPEGIHALHATLRVVEVNEADPVTVVGKILPYDSTKTLLRLQYNGPLLPLSLVMNEDPLLGNPFEQALAIIPGYDMFSYTITLVDDAVTVAVSHDGDTEMYSFTFGEGDISSLWNDYEFYFRAGNNPQADKSIGGSFEVHFYELDVAHSAPSVGRRPSARRIRQNRR